MARVVVLTVNHAVAAIAAMAITIDVASSRTIKLRCHGRSGERIGVFRCDGRIGELVSEAVHGQQPGRPCAYPADYKPPPVAVAKCAVFP